MQKEVTQYALAGIERNKTKFQVKRNFDNRSVGYQVGGAGEQN